MALPEKPQERHEEPLSLQAAGDRLFGEGWREQVSDETAADGDESGNADAASGTLESEVDAAHAERDQQAAAAEVPSDTPESERLLADQWKDYLFRQRKLKELGDIVDRKKQEVIASGGTEEDFRRKTWTHYRDALHELGVITDDHMNDFTPTFTREVVQGARQMDKALRQRKADIAALLGGNQLLLYQVNQGIDGDRREYGETHNGSTKDWDRRKAAASEIALLLDQLGEVSDYDAHLTPGDYMHILREAQAVAAQLAPKTGESPAATVGGGDVLGGTPKSGERTPLDPSELLPVRVDRMGELLFEVDSSVKAIAAEKGEELTFKERQQERLKALEQLDMLTPEQAKEWAANPKLVNDTFVEAYSQWKRFKEARQQARAARVTPGEAPVVPGSPEDNEDTIIAHVERMKMVVTAIGGLEAAISTGPGAASPEKQQQLEALYAELKDLTAKAEAFPRDDSEPLVQTPQEQADALAIEMAEIMKDTNLDEIDDAKLTRLKELIRQRNALLESTGEAGEPSTTTPEVLPGLGPLVSEAELAALEKAYREEQDPEKKAAAIEVFRQAREQYNQQQEHIAEQTRALREQVAGEKQEGQDLTYAERLKVAMGTYAELKADIETKGIDVKLGKITLWRGRAKREKLLKQAEDELTAAQIAYEKAVIAKKKEANLYEGDDAQIAAQGRNDLFTAMRGLDTEARKATNEILDDRAENRSLYRRASMKLFGWMGKSGKLATIGTVGAGVASGVGIVMSGVGWPITTAAVAGAKLSIYQGVKTKHLDALRAETIDENGNLKGAMSDADFESIRAGLSGKTEAPAESVARDIAANFFETSRQEGHERLDKAREAARKAAGKFAIGVAIGAGGAGLYKWADGSVHAMQGGSGDHSGSEGTSNGALGGVEPEPPHNGGAVDVDTGEKLAETDFDVEYGSGLERELRQFAKANGHKLNPIQADQLHHDLMRKFGKDYIDLKGISQDTYMHGTDVRLSAPAKASWDNGVPEYVQQWMEQRGLWN